MKKSAQLGVAARAYAIGNQRVALVFEATSGAASATRFTTTIDEAVDLAQQLTAAVDRLRAQPKEES